MTPKEKLQKIIDRSTLDKEEKELWRIFLDNTDNKGASSVLFVLLDNMKNLKFLTKTMKVKKEALGEMNKYKWEEIIKKEKEYIKDYE